MENDNKKYIVWGIRILCAGLFVLSAVGKLSTETVFDKPGFSIYNFEKNFLTKGFGIEAGIAQILSRILIAIEFSIAVSLLLPFYVKKVVIPGTILLLAIFSVHLGYQSIIGETGNCGCFGSLIEMTPFESLIKNLVTIALLILLVTKFKSNWDDKQNIFPVLGTGVIFVFLLFVFVPMKELNGTSNDSVQIDEEHYESGYANYFSDIDEGKKLLCFFSPTCEHCQETGKKITEMIQEYPDLMPEVRIIFMDEAGDGSATDVKNYFEFVGAEYEYYVETIDNYVPLFWGEYEFPGVLLLKNGDRKLFFNGIEDDEFKPDVLLEELKKIN